MDARTVYALKETFGYDNLYRLNSWSIAQGTTTNSYSLNYKTDNSGNMDTKTGIGTFNFNMTSAYFGTTHNHYGWTELDASNRGYNFLHKPSWWYYDYFPLEMPKSPAK